MGKRVSTTTIGIVVNSFIFNTSLGHVSARESWVFVELVNHESLVTVLENREVLELSEPNWDRRGGDEETGEQHEGNDQHGGQGNSNLLVGEDS